MDMNKFLQDEKEQNPLEFFIDRSHLSLRGHEWFAGVLFRIISSKLTLNEKN